MNDEKRMAGNYEITQSIRLGEKEIVFGIDEKSEHPYFCAYYDSNKLLGEYSECMIGSDYIEMGDIFAQRIQAQGKILQEERNAVTVPKIKITADMCVPDDYKKSIEGKVVVIRPEVLQPEYRAADRQLWLCTGGFGSHANSRGSACYCTNLYSGKKARWERYDVLGEMKKLPEWAKKRLAVIQAEREAGVKKRGEKQNER